MAYMGRVARRKPLFSKKNSAAYSIYSLLNITWTSQKAIGRNVLIDEIKIELFVFKMRIITYGERKTFKHSSKNHIPSVKKTNMEVMGSWLGQDWLDLGQNA